MKWEKRSEGVYDLTVGLFDFRWFVSTEAVRCLGVGARVGNDVKTEEQATEAVSAYLAIIESRGLEARDALAALDGDA